MARKGTGKTSAPRGWVRRLFSSLNLASISIAVNIILAIVAGYSAYTAATLDNDKKSLEQQLLIQKNIPTVSTFYILSEVGNLKGFLNSKDPLPFTNDIRKYRIYENPVFNKVFEAINNQQRDPRRTSMVTFLVITNPSDITAYSVAAEAEGATSASLGDLEGRSAILIPTAYQVERSQPAREPEYRQLRYEARIADIVRSFTRAIPKETNPAWMPVMGNLRGWARAAPEEEDHLQNLRPEREK